jgi:hypothetical protein
MWKQLFIGAVMLGAMGSVNAVGADETPAVVIFQAPEGAGTPPAVQASSSCTTFKWDRTCSGTSEQECQASCGSCTMCLDVIQFYPCVYECSCSC